MSYKILLNKERFKFSASHFTIFSANTAENLHGHNYKVQCHIYVNDLDANLGMAFSFSEIKEKLDDICKHLDEKILIPQHSIYLQQQKNENNLEVKMSNKFYSFPLEDCEILPIVNITSELLAKYICEKLIPFISFSYQRLEVDVEESTGQTASYIKSI